MMRILRLVLVFSLFVVWVPRAMAQGCVMCLASAMAQGLQAVEAMNLGILILLVPSFLIIAGVFFFTFLRRFH